MKLDGIILYDIAEAIANSNDERGSVQVDLTDGGWLNVKYEKGAEVDIEQETGACNVSGAWCNIESIEYVGDDFNAEWVDCDTEKVESITAEYMNN